MSSDEYFSSSKSSSDKIEPIINKILHDFFHIPKDISINRSESKALQKLKQSNPLVFENFDENLQKSVKNKKFIDFINSLDKNVIIDILYYFGNLHGSNANDLESKFILTISSVLSGKNAISICETEIFVYNHLLIMIILRALRKKSFITNIRKMKNPNHFYEFMKVHFYMKKVLYFLEKMYNSDVLLSDIHLKKDKKILKSVLPVRDVVERISMYVHGGPSRKELQQRIKLLIDNLKDTLVKHETYYTLSDLVCDGKLKEEELPNYVKKIYNETNKSFKSSHSISLGNRRDLVVKNVDDRT